MLECYSMLIVAATDGYIGTDLLMHDMGYLSQVGNASQSI